MEVILVCRRAFRAKRRQFARALMEGVHGAVRCLSTVCLPFCVVRSPGHDMSILFQPYDVILEHQHHHPQRQLLVCWPSQEPREPCKAFSAVRTSLRTQWDPSPYSSLPLPIGRLSEGFRASMPRQLYDFAAQQWLLFPATQRTRQSLDGSCARTAAFLTGSLYLQ